MRSFSPLPWKKNFRKMPENVDAVLHHAKPNAKFIICGEKVISEADLRDHVYRHLDVQTAEDIPTDFEPFIPSPTVGLTSRNNAIPREVPQMHLGLVRKTYVGKAPSGSRFKMHATRYTRMVRPRELIPPAMSYIAFKRLRALETKGISVFFQITEVLERDDRKGILRCLNLLQENAGVAELRPVETAEAEALQNLNLTVGWEILPDNAPSAALDRVYRRLGGKKSDAARRAQDRLGVLRSLKPIRTHLSTRGLVGYIAAEFCPTLTVFEHLEIDHAMFIARGPVDEFIRLTRPELIAKLGSGVERFEHRGDWQTRLRRLVKLTRGDQSPNAGEII
jgi:hypothetical protein